MRQNDYVIIMAGGIGSRFWPLSRGNFPKQFHDILGTGRSLIQMTLDRFRDFIPVENIFVVTNERYKGLVQEHLPELGEGQILLEPVGRNTAPCIAYGAFKIRKRDPDACIMVASSDHLIQDTEAFRKDIETALDNCRQEASIMTLGIPPTRPDTGYGYIQFHEPDSKDAAFYKVKTFTEKPSLEIAKTFLESGDFLWNSGMFVFHLNVIMEAFQSFLPDLHELFEGIDEYYDTDREGIAIGETYTRCLNISIDYGIMEKAKNVYVLPAHFDWSDLGTWGSMYEHMEKDGEGNALQGNTLAFDSKNNLVRGAGKKKLVLIDGLQDFIVVDTDDVLLICPKADEQRIKEFVAEVRKNKGEDFV